MKYQDYLRLAILENRSDENKKKLIEYYNMKIDDKYRDKIGERLEKPRQNIYGNLSYIYDFPLYELEKKQNLLSEDLEIEDVYNIVKNDILGEITTKGKLDEIYEILGEEAKEKIDEYISSGNMLIPIENLVYSQEELIGMLVKEEKIDRIDVNLINQDTKSNPSSAVLVDLPDGEKGIAIVVSRPYYLSERIANEDKEGNPKLVRILKLKDGTIYKDINEPEFSSNYTCVINIERDEDSLYIATGGTNSPFVARYTMENFERKWKNKSILSIQSMSIDDGRVSCFDMSSGNIIKFNKESGEIEETSSLKEGDAISHHEMASYGNRILAIDVGNQLKVLDEEGTLINQKGISLSGRISSVAIDSNSQSIYLGIKNNIVKIGANGYGGSLTMPNEISGITFDEDTSRLLVCHGKNIDILTPEIFQDLVYIPGKENNFNLRRLVSEKSSLVNRLKEQSKENSEKRKKESSNGRGE